MFVVNNKSFFSIERVILFIILLTCFFSYFQILNHDFINWDDDKQITDNVFVKNLNLESVGYNLNNERYTFLTLTSYSVIYKIWENNPVPFHCFSILLHLLNIILVYLLCKKLANNIYLTCLVTVLFALHPMRVESIAWISEAKDLLFTFFSLCSFLFYIKYLKESLKLKYFLIAAFFALLASFSKIQGLLVPLTLFLFDFYYKREFSISLVLEKIFLFLFIFYIFNKLTAEVIIALFVLFIVIKKNLKEFVLKKKIKIIIIVSTLFFLFLFLAYYLINNKSGLWSELHDVRNTFSFYERLLLAGFALWFYFKNLFIPISQSAVHPYPNNINGLPNEYYFTILVLIVVITISAFIFIKRRKNPDLLFFGWFFFLINISMVLHLIPIEGRLVVADRYTYLAYLGLFIVSSDIFIRFLLKKEFFKKVFFSTLTFLLIVLAVLSYNRTLAWKDTLTLFNDVVKKNPEIAFAYNNISGVYIKEHKPIEALKNINKSISIDSSDPIAYFNRAMIYYMLGKSDSAIIDFRNVIKLSLSKNDRALSYTNMGEIYHKIGNDSLAFYFYNISIKTDSLVAISYNNRGMYYFQKNDFSKALIDFEKAITIDNFYADAFNNRGWMLLKQNKLSDALIDFDKAIKINPKYALAYNNRGYLKFSLNKITEAIDDYSKAIENDSLLFEAYLNRGWAYSTLSDNNNADKDFTKVLNKIPNHQTAITNRAFSRFYQKDYINAGIDFNAAVNYFPENAKSWQNIAWYHMQLKDFDKSIPEFQKSIELDSSLENSYLNLGCIWLIIKNFHKAESTFTKLLSINPQNAEGLYWFGELYRQQGKKDSALKYFNEAYLNGSVKAKEALSLYLKK